MSRDIHIYRFFFPHLFAKHVIDFPLPPPILHMFCDRCRRKDRGRFSDVETKVLDIAKGSTNPRPRSCLQVNHSTLRGKCGGVMYMMQTRLRGK